MSPSRLSPLSSRLRSCLSGGTQAAAAALQKAGFGIQAFKV